MSTETCAYCGKTRPIQEMKRGTIIFQNVHFVGGKPKRFIDEAEYWYCADGPCHTHDQLSRIFYGQIEG